MSGNKSVLDSRVSRVPFRQIAFLHASSSKRLINCPLFTGYVPFWSTGFSFEEFCTPLFQVIQFFSFYAQCWCRCLCTYSILLSLQRWEALMFFGEPLWIFWAAFYKPAKKRGILMFPFLTVNSLKIALWELVWKLVPVLRAAGRFQSILGFILTGVSSL